MTVRPTMWQPITVVIWSVLAGMCVVATVLVPGGDSSFGFLLWLTLIAWVQLRSVRMEVTDTAVRIKRGWFPFAVTKQVARTQIRAIHYYPDVISFRGPSGKPAMRTRSDWTLQQMVAVAAELQVPVYDNRQCLNLFRIRVGKLVYNPLKGQPFR